MLFIILAMAFSFFLSRLPPARWIGPWAKNTRHQSRHRLLHVYLGHLMDTFLHTVKQGSLRCIQLRGSARIRMDDLQ